MTLAYPFRKAAWLAASAIALWSAPGTPSTDYSQEYANREVVVWLNPGYSIDEVNARWGTATLDSFPDASLYLLFAEGLDDMEGLADKMEATDPAVDEAEANYYEDTPEGVRQMVLIAVGGTYGDYEDQAITERIQLPEAHSITTGAGAKVAVLDTGVDPLHPALAPRLSADGYDFIDDDAFPWETADSLDGDGDEDIDEGYGHGTMVAGIVALVAPGADILPVRVLDDEGRTDAFRVALGIYFAVGRGADILNLSLGAPRPISTIGRAVAFAESSGCLVVAAAGNESREYPPYYPAADSNAVMVTALDSTDVKADFADWNVRVLVSAPGTGVRSAYPDDRWAIGSGCSFAAPFVTGAAALIRSVHQWASPASLESFLASGVDPIYQWEANELYQGKLGTGRINAFRCIRRAVVDAGDAGAARVGLDLAAYPNPSFGDVRFALGAGAVDPGTRLRILDVVGRQVAEFAAPASELRWDGRDAAGRPVASGVYFARLDARGHTTRARLQILR